MSNDIKVIDRGLSVGVYVNGVPMATTEQLAQAYDTDTNNLKVNFNRNKDKYTEGKHYIILQGEELKNFKNCVTNCNLVNSHSPQLYLWTERGAALHAKSLNTDKAWALYEHLVDFYFDSREMPVKKSYPTAANDIYVSQFLAAVESLCNKGYEFCIDRWGVSVPELCVGWYSPGYIEICSTPVMNELYSIYPNALSRAALYQYFNDIGLIETYADIDRSSTAIDARKQSRNLIKRAKNKHTYYVLRFHQKELEKYMQVCFSWLKMIGL